ncbi:MAG: MBL fold metallo-hydrolase [Patescibacteria group bacterium]
MDITYIGHSSFKIRTKSATVITDPFDPASTGIKFPPQEADIVTISHDHADHNYLEKISGYKKVVAGPGEYEIMGISIIGISTFHDDKEGSERGKNTIYVYEAEGLRIVHLGDLGHALSESQIEALGEVDILMIPVGGVYTIGPKEASDLVSAVEPYFVIPMHFGGDKLQPLEAFLKEVGQEGEKMSKFSIKKMDIEENQNTKVVVLENK